jgi:hypothetical protein
MSSRAVKLELDHLWRPLSARDRDNMPHSESLMAENAILAPRRVIERARFIEAWLTRSIAQYAVELRALEHLEADYASRVHEKKQQLQRLEEQIRQAEKWLLTLDTGNNYLIESKEVKPLPSGTGVAAVRVDEDYTPRRRSHPGSTVAGPSEKETKPVGLEGSAARTRIKAKEVKSLQLLISSALAFGICIACLILAFVRQVGLVSLAPASFWIALAIGTFGVAGSNYIYLRRLWRKVA